MAAGNQRSAFSLQLSAYCLLLSAHGLQFYWMGCPDPSYRSAALHASQRTLISEASIYEVNIFVKTRNSPEATNCRLRPILGVFLCREEILARARRFRISSRGGSRTAHFGPVRAGARALRYHSLRLQAVWGAGHKNIQKGLVTVELKSLRKNSKALSF